MCHLNHTTRDHPPKIVFKDAYSSVYSIDYASLSTALTYKSCFEAVQLDCPSAEAGITFEILGSCNGLICLGLYKNAAAMNNNFKDVNDICVWNPTTREYREIRIRPQYLHHPAYNKISYGFGYDSSMNDYKFVRICYWKKDDYSKLEVYPLGSDLWKTIEKIPYSFHETVDRPGLLFNGALHWIGINTTKNTQCIVSFDVNNERLTDLSIPEKTMKQVSIPEETMKQDKHVGVLTGFLCLSSTDKCRTDVWVMLDYGVKESWTKQFTFINKPYRKHEFNPLWIQNGKALMAGSTPFVLYNPKGFRFEDVLVYSSDMEKLYIRSYFYYVKSLVPLNSGTYVKKSEDSQRKHA
ncbi:F-box/kelch-repeat protein At3g06240-like [Papaver somniferum]|uniref:F-box/kelch-repeat protein At3g06240-like n=1 Tax=Papaver somniferum TaxID=3469 RepID=UPI000E6FA5DC|nr:F-box/kelch-repeat protein At3g06240-like [Papaver somniferum]